MSTLRFHAIKETFNRPVIDVQEPQRRSAIFGSNVFNNSAMRQFLTKDSFKSVQDAVENGSKIDRAIADHISTGMKEWAIAKGATHYTHWFQPLTGTTAEKHDAFFETTRSIRLLLYKLPTSKFFYGTIFSGFEKSIMLLCSGSS